MDSKRLDGWKAISLHLKRDRSTVMRWYRERGLPVRRMPGGKQASVYALVDELDAWIRSAEDEPVALQPAEASTDAEPAVDPMPPPRHPAWRSVRWPAGIAGVALLAGAIGYLAPRPDVARAPAAQQSAPASPELERLYLSAREKWAERTPASLTRAVRDFEILTRRDPSFAPGFVGLAECYLLLREFGAVADGVAYPRAERAVRAALAIDGQLYSAHRADGFIAYWWRGDARGAGAAFRRALDLAPNEPQTLFWYANVLADNGESELALKLFARAMAIAPGQVEIALDHAWAQWMAGHEDVADQLLRQLATPAVENAAYYSIIGDIRLSRADWAGYVDALEKQARLRSDVRMQDDAADLRAAQAAGDPAVAALVLTQALAQAEETPGHDHAWATLIASTMGDRGQVIRILRRAAARHERWGSAGYVRRIANRWQDDAEVIDLLADLRRPAVG